MITATMSAVIPEFAAHAQLIGPVAMFGFRHPGRLLLWIAIPVLLAAYVLAMRVRNRRGMRFTNTAILDAVVPKQSQWRRHLAVVLSILSLVTLTLAFATPEADVKVPRERATVAVVVDASWSMKAKDVKPNRLAAAKDAAKEFVDKLPDKYNITLVSMAGSASTLVPPTRNHHTVKRLIDSIKPQKSTAIGEGIYIALQAIDQAPKSKGKKKKAPGAVALLSDGENTVGRSPLQAAAHANKQHIRVHTIAFGTDHGYVELEGKRYSVPPNKKQLAHVADKGGGKAFTADDRSQLKKVYSNIGSEVGYVKKKRPITGQFAGYGLALGVLAALGAISLGARWP